MPPGFLRMRRKRVHEQSYRWLESTFSSIYLKEFLTVRGNITSNQIGEIMEILIAAAVVYWFMTK